MMDKANLRLYMLRICKYYGYTLEELTILSHTLIVSLFTYTIEVQACAYGSKYLSKISQHGNMVNQGSHIHQQCNPN